MPSARFVSCAAAQSGCQSPGHPISELWLPGTETTRSPGTGPGPAAPSIASPTPAYVEAAALFPAASTDTARYSTTVPAASFVTSWNTRGLVVSAVPSGVQVLAPSTRYPTDVSLHALPGTSAATGATPDSPAPAVGADTVIPVEPPLAQAPTCRSARSTTADSAGTVSATDPVASVVTVVVVPYSGA